MNSLNIQFNNQIQNVKGLLSEALHSGYMADVTLVSDDLKHMSAHKFILAACSPVFRNILVDDSSQSSQILYLKGISFDFLRNILKFVYNGEVNIDSIEAPAFLKILQEFQIHDVTPTNFNEDQEIQNKEHLGDMKCIEIQKPANNEIRSDDESMMMIKKESDDISQESNCRVNEIKELVMEGDFTPEEINQSHNRTIEKTPCPKCGKLVKNLYQHLLWKHNPNSKKFHCPECSYVSQNATDVKRHISNIHMFDMDNSRRFPCDQCGKDLKTLATLNKHIRRVHENLKDTCQICQKQFSSGLHKHMETDHEGKRFHCEYCDHQSTQRSSLKMHIEAKHKGIKHICNQCGKSFSQSGTLNIHIKTKHKNS